MKTEEMLGGRRLVKASFFRTFPMVIPEIHRLVD